MPNPSQKLHLDENHRRVVSVVLRRVEQTCDSVLRWLECRPGLLYRVTDELAPEETAKIRERVNLLREEIRNFAREVKLDVAEQSQRRAIAALLSATLIDVEEVNSAQLHGYGPLSEEAGRLLDAKLTRLATLLEQTSRILERSSHPRSIRK